MRKYKQVHRKEIIYSIDEWKMIEERAASVRMKTGTFIKRMSLDGHITYFTTRFRRGIISRGSLRNSGKLLKKSKIRRI